MSERARSEELTAELLAVQTPGAGKDALKLIVCTAIGIFMFFIPINVNGKSSIPLDHLVAWLKTLLGPGVSWLMLLIIIFGTVRPFYTGSWKTTFTKTVFSFLNIVGLAASLMMILGAPSWLAEKSIGPFLWDTLVSSVGMIVPVGAIFLGFLIGFGLMEFVGVFVRPIMKPIWKTPGRSAVDAVASFVGSYSLGLLLTNRVYKSGGYTAKEAAIIAAGFSTVSVTFMVVVARTLGLMDYWLLYFLVSLVVTFVVTALTVRIPPLSQIPDEYYPGAAPTPEVAITSGRFRYAWAQARATLRNSPSITKTMWLNLKDGIIMTANILPSIMSVGLIGLLLAKHTPIFDWMAWLFYPVLRLVGADQPLETGKAISLGLVEMFLPAGAVGDQTDLATRFIVGVTCISGLIFLSAMVPSILATDIPLKFWQLIVIWFERVVITVVLTAPLAYLLL